MKQQFLELIKRKQNEPQHYEVQKVLEELRSEVEKMDEWIPVTEKLPEQFEDVLVYWDKWMCVDNLWNRHTYKNGFSRHMDVTHWMPLPNPPTI